MGAKECGEDAGQGGRCEWLGVRGGRWKGWVQGERWGGRWGGMGSEEGGGREVGREVGSGEGGGKGMGARGSGEG